MMSLIPEEGKKESFSMQVLAGTYTLPAASGAAQVRQVVQLSLLTGRGAERERERSFLSGRVIRKITIQYIYKVNLYRLT